MRPRKEMSEKDWEQADKLAQLQCTGEEIAAFFEMSYDTLERRVRETHSISYTEWFSLKSVGGKISLRKRQFDLAKKNAAMAIFLGKNILGQTDRIEETIKQAEPFKLNYTVE